MNIWHPAPRGLIVAAATERWTRERPATELVVYLWVWSQREDGERPTRRQIARLFGWTEHYARKMLIRVAEDHEQWLKMVSPKTVGSRHPPEHNDSEDLQNRITQDSPRIIRDSPDRVREFTTQSNSKHINQIGMELGRWHRKQ